MSSPIFTVLISMLTLRLPFGAGWLSTVYHPRYQPEAPTVRQRAAENASRFRIVLAFLTGSRRPAPGVARHRVPGPVARRPAPGPEQPGDRPRVENGRGGPPKPVLTE